MIIFLQCDNFFVRSFLKLGFKTTMEEPFMFYLSVISATDMKIEGLDQSRTAERQQQQTQTNTT